MRNRIKGSKGASWLLMPLAGMLVAFGSLAFDAWGFSLTQSSSLPSTCLWLMLFLCDGTFAYALLALLAGMSSATVREAVGKSLAGLGCALLAYYVLSMGLNLRPTGSTGRLLLQAAFWCLAALLLSFILAPLAQKMSDSRFRYNQAAAGVALSLLGAPYWFVLFALHQDGLFRYGAVLCAVVPLLMLAYRLRYGKFLQLLISVLCASVVCVVGMLVIYHLGYEAT